MEKIWFLFILEKQEGPYTYSELKKDVRLTPDTFAWREGMKDWLPIRDIPELEKLFCHEEEPQKTKNEENVPVVEGSEEIALDWGKGPSFSLLWLLISLLLLLYLLYLLSE